MRTHTSQRMSMIPLVVSLLLISALGAATYYAAESSVPTGPAISQALPGDLPVPDAAGHVTLNNSQWKKRLTPEQYQILREQGTEPPFGPLYHQFAKNGPGTYACVACGETLFRSSTMFTSGTGWPSFFDIIPGHVERSVDDSHGMVRDEVHCARCGGHLGHVFDDGPAPSHLRYCIDGVALAFIPDPAPAVKAPAGTPAR